MSQLYGSRLNSLIICVDRYVDKVLCGRIYDRYPQEGRCFLGAMDLLKCIEGILDSRVNPQPFCIRREFQNTFEQLRPDQEAGFSGKGIKATFLVQILFRQNASWQGSVLWVERKIEESFRSVLELLLLIDNALSSTPEMVNEN